MADKPSFRGAAYLRSLAAIEGRSSTAGQIDLAATLIEAQTAALRRARELIAHIREQDLESYTLAGDPTTMDEAEAAAIGEYDAVLAEIDGVLNADPR
jgi:hypothetical protein